MSLKELIEATTTTFPRDISLSEAEELIMYLAENLPANINYHIAHHKSAIHEEEGIAIHDGTVKISGTITSAKTPMAFSSFTLRPARADTSRLSEIGFELIPGYDTFPESSTLG